MKKLARIAKRAKDFLTTGHLNIPSVLGPVISKGHAGMRKNFILPRVSYITN